ncbi:hypothetical protein GCM10022252_41760 [Streptosporangium oxazolinicum]|uniref:N-acetylmuramoyl-L-alanine amidase n=1 Tax=Streptosporangium oxazolinicum TaxID=909287 RepID=A0ABP8B145_9ACTN
MARLRRLAVLLAGSLIPLVCLSGQPVGASAVPAASAAPASPVAEAFTRAAATHDVPRDLLVTLGYAETRLDNHGGAPSASGGYGMMHLVSSPAARTLERAAKLTGLPVATLRSDDSANIMGGAAVLRAHADALGLDATARKDIGRWYPAVAGYSNASSPTLARLYADAVYELLTDGVRAVTPGGETITVTARAVRPDLGAYAGVEDLNRTFAAAAVDYPQAHWAPAHPSNYAVSNRPSSDRIDRIVIHVAQGSYAGTISWFQTGPRSNATSAHYVVRSSDGDITQTVREKDRAFHAGNDNRRSIGIEHEGFVNNASWFTDSMYRASAALTRDIAGRYGIPKDRAHIVGHSEVPGADHTDPGPHWDWTRYMQLVTGSPTNPYTPQEICGSGYDVVDSAALGTAATVYLLYNTTNGNNCVTTVKRTSLGTATATTAYLEVHGKTRITDTGNFAYYAGPVRAAAPGTCVKWGGKAGSTTYDSPFEHCG